MNVTQMRCDLLNPAIVPDGGGGGGGGGVGGMAWQEIKAEAMPVNEALYVGVIERTVWSDRS